MTVLDNVAPIRPADDMIALLRTLADDLESGKEEARNIYLVLEHQDAEVVDVRCYGPCDCQFRVAGWLLKGAKDVLP